MYLLKLIVTLKLAQIGKLNNKADFETTNYDKIIMTPPYFSTSAYPSYSTTNGFNPQNQNYASIPSSSYQNFRFKSRNFIFPNMKNFLF